MKHERYERLKFEFEQMVLLENRTNGIIRVIGVSYKKSVNRLLNTLDKETMVAGEDVTGGCHGNLLPMLNIPRQEERSFYDLLKRIIRDRNLGFPEKYKIELKIRSIVGMSNDVPKLESLFQFDIELYDYPDKPPLFMVAEKASVPFHPHFDRRWGWGKCLWPDFLPFDPKQSLCDRILRMAHSLQYRPGFIHDDSSCNEPALKFYWMQKGKDPHTFPTDIQDLPLAFDKKNFEIQVATKPAAIANEKAENAVGVSSQQSQKKFKIIEEKPPIIPAEQVIPNFRVDNSLKSFAVKELDNRHSIYISTSAFRGISSHIGWLKITQSNVVEQGGILVGKAFVDPIRGINYTVVYEAIAGKSARGTRAYLEMNHATWVDMYNQVDSFLAASAKSEEDFYIVGWYHTHPNGLNVFMSATDQATQSRLFPNDWQYSIVLNPQRGEWKAYYGHNATECRGYVYLEIL